jgi:hypothetical protein
MELIKTSSQGHYKSDILIFLTPSMVKQVDMMFKVDITQDVLPQKNDSRGK